MGEVQAAGRYRSQYYRGSLLATSMGMGSKTSFLRIHRCQALRIVDMQFRA